MSFDAHDHPGTERVGEVGTVHHVVGVAFRAAMIGAHGFCSPLGSGVERIVNVGRVSKLVGGASRSRDRPHGPDDLHPNVAFEEGRDARR